VGSGLSLSPAADSSSLSMRDECATALTYPSRSPADVAWLQQCVSALTAPTVEPTATPTPTPSATPSPTQPPQSAPTYRTSGRFLLDPQGARVVVRGPEQVLWSAGWLPNSLVSDIGRTGANTVRILPYLTDRPPTGEPPNTLAQIEDQIRRGIAAHMLVDVAIDGGRHPEVYLRADVKALLLRYERWIVIHAKGESYEGSGTEWARASTQVVSSLRSAGYRAPLYIMANQGGRNLPTVLAQGASVVAADPLHNVVFGWQAYWGSNGGYQNAYGMSLEQAFARVAAASFPIQVGLIWHSDHQIPGDQQTIPYASLIQLAQANAISWLWWDYRMGRDNLLPGGAPYGAWTSWAGPVIAAFGMAQRTAFQQAQSAP
jgi:mannan endo-1,4-beta-mannosidase